MSDDRREYMRRYYLRNREKYIANALKWKKEHPLHKRWAHMLRRCGLNPSTTDYERERYADRGITVCEEWRTFENFEKWCLDNGYRKGLQLDRIDNDGNYCPENCRFVTAKQNNNNRCNNIRIRDVPISLYYDSYANKEVLPYVTFCQRISRCGWSVERALYSPVSRRDMRVNERERESRA